MPDILHRISIDASAENVHDLVATPEGIGRWWNGRPADGSTAPGDTFGVRFGDSDQPAAVFRVVTDEPGEVAWQVVEGPDAWVGTVISFGLHTAPGRTTLLFRHAGWAEQSEFMSGCSTNWGAYLTSLKHGAETGAFAPYPAGEISRWD